MFVTQILLHGGTTAPETAPDIPTQIAAMAAHNAALVLVFGAPDLLHAVAAPLAVHFPQAIRVGCSTAGEISGAGVSNQSCVITALSFASVYAVEAVTVLHDMADSYRAGARLADQLPRAGLRAVLLLGQGVAVNGSALITGMSEILGNSIPITGGLAGDQAAFQQTWVMTSTGVYSNRLVCLGLYGERLRFSHGSFGGWSPFGPARKVTRCENNVLFELDGESALGIYKRYLGEHAKDLPASGLLFPLAMLGSDHSEMGLIRTILGTDEATGSLTLAGEIDPEGYLRLMHASTDALVEGAEAAAMAAKQMLDGAAGELRGPQTGDGGACG
jgi:hypothetical protein